MRLATAIDTATLAQMVTALATFVLLWSRGEPFELRSDLLPAVGVGVAMFAYLARSPKKRLMATLTAIIGPACGIWFAFLVGQGSGERPRTPLAASAILGIDSVDRKPKSETEFVVAGHFLVDLDQVTGGRTIWAANRYYDPDFKGLHSADVNDLAFAPGPCRIFPPEQPASKAKWECDGIFLGDVRDPRSYQDKQWHVLVLLVASNDARDLVEDRAEELRGRPGSILGGRAPADADALPPVAVCRDTTGSVYECKL